MLFLATGGCTYFGGGAAGNGEAPGQEGGAGQPPGEAPGAGSGPGAGGGAPLLPDAWTYEKGAISIRIIPTRNLNVYEDRPHALLLGIYQMQDPNTFNEMRGTREGLQKLLGQVTPEAASGILSSTRHVVQPNRESVLVLDRAESARYIGLAAGYYDLEPERVSRLLKIPVYQEAGEELRGFSKINPFADPPPAPPPRPGKLKIWIELGDYSIEDLSMVAY